MKLLLSAATALLLIADLAHGQPVCTGADLSGRPWSFFAMEDLDGEALPDPLRDAFTYNCTINFDQTGAIVVNSSCVLDSQQTPTLGGQFTVNAGCRVTGPLLFQFPPPAPFEEACTVDGAMAPDKLTASGVGNCGPSDIFIFNMVRR